jgi:hypothetical protein
MKQETNNTILNADFQSLIRQNGHLFWWVPNHKKEQLTTESLIEAILNYGDAKSVKQLFETVGIYKVAGIFRQQASNPRNKYQRPVKHYFSLYFDKYAPEHS